MDEPGHVPVLIDQVLELLAPEPGQIVLDCTIGRGGHAEHLLPRLAPGGRYVGLDLDPDNIAFAAQRLQPLATECGVDLTVMQSNFAAARRVLDAVNIERVNAVLADLGFASNQIDDPQRGFSFSEDGPLDMRLDPGQPTKAAELVNRLSQRELADLIYRYGDERFSRKIARKIVERREAGPIQTTSELAELVRRAYGPRGRRSRIDPATRTFMALRIAVNGELEALDRLLSELPGLLADRGRIGMISFHSLEDRRVKQTFRKWQTADRVELLTRKPIIAGEAEMAANPRSRSAKLRGVAWKSSG